MQNNDNDKNLGEQKQIDLSLDETVDTQNQSEIFDFVHDDIPAIEKNSDGEDNYFFDDDEKDLKSQIENINLSDHKSKINDTDKQLLIKFINEYRGGQMANIETFFDLINGNLNVDSNIDKQDLLADFIYNLEINMEEDCLLDDSTRQKFSRIANLISNSKEDFKNKSENAIKVVETVGNFVKNIVSDPKTRDDIEYRIEIYADVYGPEKTEA